MSTWTPVTPRAGGLVHITSLTDAHRTQCNRVCTGWVVALRGVDCQTCKERVEFNVGSRSKRRRE